MECKEPFDVECVAMMCGSWRLSCVEESSLPALNVFHAFVLAEFYMDNSLFRYVD